MKMLRKIKIGKKRLEIVLIVQIDFSCNASLLGKCAETDGTKIVRENRGADNFRDKEG